MLIDFLSRVFKILQFFEASRYNAQSFCMNKMGRLRWSLIYVLMGLFSVHSAQALETVTLQLKWHHQFQFAGYYAAKEMGFYQDEGLDVNITPVSLDKNPIQNVLNGAAQYGVGSNDLLLIRAQGEPVVVLGVLIQHSPYVLLALKRPDLETVHDLVGKKVFIDPYAKEILAYLHSVGIPLDRINLIETNNYNAYDLLSGKVDAYAGYSSNDPFYLDKIKADYLTFNPRSAGIDFYGDNLFTTEQEIQQHPERVKAFLRASLKGWSVAVKAPLKVIDLMIEKGYYPASERDKLIFESEKIINLVHADLIPLGMMHQDRWNYIRDTYVDFNMLSKDFSLDGFMYGQEKETIPEWIIWALVILSFLSMTFITLLWKNRLLLKEKTISETRLSAILNTAVDGVVTINSRGIVQSFSASAEKMFGWRADEVVGQNVNILMPEPDRSRHDGYIHNYLTTGQKKIIGIGRETVGRHKNGEAINIRLGIGELVLPDETMFVGLITDITERKKIELKLKEREQRISALLKNMPGVAFRCKGASLLETEFISDSIVSLSGWQVDDFLTHRCNLWQLADPDDRAMIEHLIDHASQAGEQFSLEFRILHKQGYYVWVLCSGIVILDQEHNSEWIDGVIVNITDRHIMEQNLKKAKIEAEKAAAAKASFLANMSHEIRTPMNSIMGFSDVMMDTPLNKDQQRHMSVIRNASRSLLHLLNDILDSAKLEEGKLELEQLDFSLTDLLDSVISTFWVQARNKKLELNLSIGNEVPDYVTGAPDRIRQILVNLLSNALKFTEIGEVSLQVNVREVGWVEFCVIDTGIGIDKDKLEMIFDPFTQEDSSMSRRFGGTGLGTTICRQLVALMGGEIWVSSQKGQGSEFIFKLPLSRAHKTLETNESNLPKLPELKILCVDDIQQNLDLLEFQLQKIGHQVIKASNGSEALNFFKTEVFDLILMDIHMPVMDGLTAVREIRALEHENGQRPVPIIALSASVLKEEQLAAFEAGVDGFAHKPVNLTALNQEICLVLKQNKNTIDRLEESVSVSSGLQIDLQNGISLWGSEPRLMQELSAFQLMHEHCPTQLRHLLQTSNWESLKHESHGLRGLTGNLGLKNLYRLFGRLERAATQQNESVSHVLLTELEQGMEGFCREFNQLKEASKEDGIPLNALNEAEDNTPLLMSVVQQLKQKCELAEIDMVLMQQLIQLSEAKQNILATEIVALLNEFQFKPAMESLEKMQAELGLI